MFAKIKKFYNLGIYTKIQVAAFVAKDVITAEQYEQITGEPYQEEE